MNHKCDITIWGVRGSMPNPSKNCMEYGGNTVCTTLQQDNTLIILDAGTGINAFGRFLVNRPNIHRIDILLSHLHIDHIMGLFSFSPLFQSNIEIHLYGVTGFTQYLKKILRPPFWPLGIDDFPARLYFHEISPEDTFTIHLLYLLSQEFILEVVFYIDWKVVKNVLFMLSIVKYTKPMKNFLNPSLTLYTKVIS